MMDPNTSQMGPHAAATLLQGWTIPLRRAISGQPGYFHHTYVTSGLGDRWGCAGRDGGGQAICGGQASIDVARCLAGADGRAGIVYGLTGVCHQIANRILHPAGKITVQAARGYALTVGVFGEYGIGRWRQLMACYRSRAPVGAASRADDGTEAGAPQPSALRTAVGRQIEGSTMPDGDFQDRAQSLRRLLLEQDRAVVSAATAQLVVDEHRCFWRFQEGLLEALSAQEIDRRQYLDRFNSKMSDLTRMDREILGEQAYAAVFGLAFDAADSMIDAEVFLSEEPDGTFGEGWRVDPRPS